MLGSLILAASRCLLLHFVFLRLLPPPSSPRRRYAAGFDACFALLTGGFSQYTVSAFPSISFLRVFPGFIARPFRGHLVWDWVLRSRIFDSWYS